MATVQAAPRITEEIAEFLARGPTRDEVLSFQPSPQSQERARELLDRLRDGRVSAEEQRELDQFEHAETLMRLLKARIRTPIGNRA